MLCRTWGLSLSLSHSHSVCWRSCSRVLSWSGSHEFTMQLQTDSMGLRSHPLLGHCSRSIWRRCSSNQFLTILAVWTWLVEWKHFSSLNMTRDQKSSASFTYCLANCNRPCLCPSFSFSLTAGTLWFMSASCSRRLIVLADTCNRDDVYTKVKN